MIEKPNLLDRLDFTGATARVLVNSNSPMTELHWAGCHKAGTDGSGSVYTDPVRKAKMEILDKEVAAFETHPSLNLCHPFCVSDRFHGASSARLREYARRNSAQCGEAGQAHSTGKEFDHRAPDDLGWQAHPLYCHRRQSFDPRRRRTAQRQHVLRRLYARWCDGFPQAPAHVPL